MFASPIFRRPFRLSQRIFKHSRITFCSAPALKPKPTQRQIPLSPFWTPEIAAQWHPKKNGDLRPDQHITTATRVWWKCDKGSDHEWATTIYHRIHSNKTGCPFCSHNTLSVTNSLATLSPKVAAQWHPTKNGDTTPNDVVNGTPKKYWFTCDAGPDHEWEATVDSRTSKKSGCPCCDGKKLSVTNSLATLSPDVAAEWHPTKNGDTTPADVVNQSNKKYWFQCDEGPDHEWESKLSNRTSANKHGCPCCVNRKVSVTNSLQNVCPGVAESWHPTDNGDLTPADVVYGTCKKVWWLLDSGDEKFATVRSRTHYQKGGKYYVRD